MLLWGGAGGGKTSLACTAPGRKLLVNFDPDGDASVAGWDNVDVVDLSSESYDIVTEAKHTNDPFGLSRIIEQYNTVIFDSLTNFAYKALLQGVYKFGNKNISIERPGLQSYGVRNALTLQLVKNALALTKRFGKHCIFTAHENTPEKNEDGVVIQITVALGGQLPDQTALDFSEVWNVNDPGKGRARRILIRPARQRRPCKTRMFKTDGEPEFEWDYDINKREGDTIAEWYDLWKANGSKIALPGSIEYDKTLKRLQAA